LCWIQLQVEQQLYPLKTVDIDLAGITTGEPAAGYQVKSVTASPSYLSVAGTNDLLKSLTMLEVSSRIDLRGTDENLVRAVKVEKPQNAQYMSEDAVYVTIEIVPITPETGAPT
jgi:YbbR domain-containing protein